MKEGEKVTDTREAEKVKRTKNQCLGSESNQGQSELRSIALLTELRIPTARPPHSTLLSSHSDC